jgi:CheY-like chemotaxis protein
MPPNVISADQAPSSLFQPFRLGQGIAMSATPASTAVATGASTSSTRYAGAADRRRRKRAKISAQVHVRVKDAAEPFEEICTSVDVSRDGLLFTTTKLGYRRGQQLEIVFPYSSAAAALNQSQAAEIVRITEQPGKRIAVAVEFLASRTGVQQAPSASPASVSNTQQSVVLAVEPDPRTAEIIRTILQQDGYTVIIVPSSNEALETLRTTVPAVFIGEVESKDMSGHDLCLIIKRNERLQHVPVILLTRSAQPADYSASHQLGAVVCMAKPFKPERLLHVVRLVAPPPTQKSAYGSRVLGSSIERSI